MYKSCGEDGVVDKKVGKKGVLLARRDTSVFVRNLYEQIIMKIFNNEDRDDILYYILEQINKLFSNSFPYKDFVVTKSVGSTHNMECVPHTDESGKVIPNKMKIGDYIVPKLPTDKKDREEQFKKKGVETESEYYEKCLPAQVQLAEKMRSRGQPVQVGSRLEFLVSDIVNHQSKQYDKLESIDYFVAHSDVLTVDFFYYLKVAINSIDEILNIAFDRDDKRYKYRFKKDFIQDQYNFRYKIRRKVIDGLKDLYKFKLVFKN
jgi:DNA polymerase elongation subunit (family B)